MTAIKNRSAKIHREKRLIINGQVHRNNWMSWPSHRAVIPGSPSTESTFQMKKKT
uniref:Uncharacterized protein n=1 Tax=Anguilla anguilla TaxID=7936 RepID=A0A0E9WLW6_ANGAN